MSVLNKPADNPSASYWDDAITKFASATATTLEGLPAALTNFTHGLVSVVHALKLDLEPPVLNEGNDGKKPDANPGTFYWDDALTKFASATSSTQADVPAAFSNLVRGVTSVARALQLDLQK